MVQMNDVKMKDISKEVANKIKYCKDCR